ncbi:MAG: phosphopentomutase [Clostridia bacterium]
MLPKRVFLIVLDSLGIGAMNDAEKYGDVGSNTLASIMSSKFFSAPNLQRLGMFNIDGVVGDKAKNPIGSYARIAEMSCGKDTTIGHWEIAGIVSKTPLPTYPNGFPDEILERFSALTGRGVLCNKPYSGTKVILDYGDEHLKTGDLIVYTSADSVFQVAAHEDKVPIKLLYEYCQIARNILQGKHGVGRVIARPFTGVFPNFTRTANRHDFSLEPPSSTMLDVLASNGFDSIGVGKINDIFAGRGITDFCRIKNNADGMDKTFEFLNKAFNGLCFVNLVDFDMTFGHRNDVDGYANAVSEFDVRIGEFILKMQPEDILILTADHGCDPLTASTDHSREYVFMLAYGHNLRQGANLGTLNSFSDISATILDYFKIKNELCGASFLKEIINV